jgi:hypothetical protein
MYIGRKIALLTSRLPAYPLTRLPAYPLTRLPAYPLTRLPAYPLLQQRRECRPVLTQVIQELAHVGFVFRQNSQAVARADLGHDEQAPIVFQDGRSKRAASGTESETRGILGEGGGERGEGFGLERPIGRMLDRKSIGAQHEYRLDTLPLKETAYDFSQTGHPIDLRGG